MSEDGYSGDSGNDSGSDSGGYGGADSGGYGSDSGDYGGGSFSSGFGGDMDSFSRAYNDAVNSANGWGGVSGGSGGWNQGSLRAFEQNYLNSDIGSTSLYQGMLNAWKGNLSDTQLSSYMDSLGTGYDQRANLLGGLDAMYTGRGGWGDFASSAVNMLSNFLPYGSLLSSGTDAFQRLANGGTIGGNLLGGLIGGATGNNLLGQAVTYSTNMINGDTLQNQLKYALQRNAGTLLNAAGVPASAIAGLNVAKAGNNLLKQTGVGGVSFGSNSSGGLF